MSKRTRACEACHRLKIRCDVNTTYGGACERCNRNGLECIPSAPRLQRDRINELEAQVQELKSALRERSTSTSTTSGLSPESLPDDNKHAVLSFLDARIPPSKQKRLFRLYGFQAGDAWPVVRLPEKLETIRAASPVLLLSVMIFAFTQETQGVELEVHDDLVREAMRVFGEEIIGRGQRSLEIVQALLISVFWNKGTRIGLQGSCYQLVQIATDMAIDIGIAGPSLQPSPAAYFSQHDDAASFEARRTWLACYVALSTSSISTRRVHTVPWNAHHQSSLLFLESNGDPSDILLCQIARITQINQDIAQYLHLCHIGTYIDSNEYNTHAIMETLKIKVDAWVAQIPPALANNPTLKVLRHVAMIHIYEPVLHTPTNKSSFAAPFIPGRISFKDFPKPHTVIPPLATALRALVENCHAAIDTAAGMDAALVLDLPTFCFSPTVLYSLFVLVSLLVASTDPSNTYGQYLSKEDFLIEQCALKLRALTSELKSLDPTMSCYTTRLFDAAGWLEEWYNDYTAILQRYEANIVQVGKMGI